MNQYEIMNAAEKVEGYMLPRPGETAEEAFNRARAEAIEKYEAYIKTFRELSFDQFLGHYPRYKAQGGRKEG